VDTLQALAADGDELFLVIGSETFLDLLSWREPRRVASLARLVVIPRAGSAFDPEERGGAEGAARDRPRGRPSCTSAPDRRGRRAEGLDRARRLACRCRPPSCGGACARVARWRSDAAGRDRLRPLARPLPRGARVTARASAEHKAQRCRQAPLDRKALDLVLLDVQGLSSVTDYFLVCSGRSTTHLASITEAIRAELKQDGIRPLHAEARRRAAGCCSTTATCSCTCSSRTRAPTTRSSVCGATHRPFPSTVRDARLAPSQTAC
jgi:hypothetical protein